MTLFAGTFMTLFAGTFLGTFMTLFTGGNVHDGLTNYASIILGDFQGTSIIIIEHYRLA